MRRFHGTEVKVGSLRRLLKGAPVVARSAGPTLHMQGVFIRRTTKSWMQELRKTKTNSITGRGREGGT